MTTQAIEQLQALDDYDNCMGLVGKPEIGTEELIELVIENEDMLTCLNKIAKQTSTSYDMPDTEYHKVERVKEMLEKSGRLPQEIYDN